MCIHVCTHTRILVHKDRHPSKHMYTCVQQVITICICSNIEYVPASVDIAHRHIGVYIHIDIPQAGSYNIEIFNVGLVVNAYVCVCACVCVHVFLYVHTYVCIYLSIYLSIYIYIYIYV